MKALSDSFGGDKNRSDRFARKTLVWIALQRGETVTTRDDLWKQAASLSFRFVFYKRFTNMQQSRCTLMPLILQLNV